MNKLISLTLSVTAWLLSGMPAQAQQNTSHLKAGDPAPHFTAVDDEGTRWNSSDVIGKKILVVYFYPAAMTGGCTKQACSYRDHQKELQEYGVEVVGVSGDYPENLKYFKQANNLNFTLLSDPKGKIAKAFGVPLRQGGEIQRHVGNKEVSLKRGVTASRWTFIIGKDGKILYVNTSVNAANDSQQVLEVIRKEQGK